MEVAAATPFASWWMGGFEGSTFRFHDGRPVDCIGQSGHDRRARDDYRDVAELGLRTVRDALRWRLIETAPGRYDWSSWTTMLEAAEAAGIQVVWDLCHFALPDGADPFDPALPERFADFAEAAAEQRRRVTGAPGVWCPVNEIGYWTYAATDAAYMQPVAQGRDAALKSVFVAMAAAATRRLRRADPRSRFLSTEPLCHIVDEGDDAPAARAAQASVWEAWNLLAAADALDVVGVNYYADNQWRVADHRRQVGVGMREHRPLHRLLQDVWARYRRPIVVSETGAEGDNGPGWLHYVAAEVRLAMAADVPVQGLCIYPVMDYPGWVDDRHCACGPIAVASGWGERSSDTPVAAALRREQRIAAVWDESARPARPRLVKASAA